MAPVDIVLSNRNPQYLQPSGRNPFPLAQRRTLRSVDLLQGAIVQVEVYLESGAARASGAGDEHDRGAGWCGQHPRKPCNGKTGVVPSHLPHVNPQSRVALAAGHLKRDQNEKPAWAKPQRHAFRQALAGACRHK